MWAPKTCCFCFDAKNGSLILGSLKLGGALFNIFLCASGILSAYIHASGLQFLPSCVQNPDGTLCEQQLTRTAFLINIAVMSLYSIQAFVSIMLIHGIRKRNFLLMIPFMAFVCAGITFYMFGSVLSFVYYSHHIQHALIHLGVVVLAVMLEAFFLLVIRSHYQELKRDVRGDYNRLQEARVEAQPIKAPEKC